MKIAFRRAVTAVVVMFACAFLGFGGAVASADSAARTTGVEKMQAEYAKTVTPNEYARTVHLFDRMLAADRGQTHTTSRQVTGQAGGEFCGTIPKEAGIAYGWYLKLKGAVAGVGTVVVSAVNIPAGALIAAVGIAEGWAGEQVIDWSEKNLPKTVCVSWS